MKIRNPFRRSPMHRYLARDADPSHHGPAGTFEGIIVVHLTAGSPLLAQRQLERTAGELLDGQGVYFAELRSISRLGGEEATDEP